MHRRSFVQHNLHHGPVDQLKIQSNQQKGHLGMPPRQRCGFRVNASPKGFVGKFAINMVLLDRHKI
jgi:hypothetical protein